jgi:hypothetical protein
MWLIIALMSSLCAVAAPPTAAPGPDPRVEARAKIRKLVADIQLLERIRAKTPAIALDGNCVDEKLAEARAGLQIAGGELGRLGETPTGAGGDEADYSLHRLRLLVDRADELVRAARVCATEELSTIDTTKVEVEISPNLPDGDPTRPPSSFQPVERPPSSQ